MKTLAEEVKAFRAYRNHNQAEACREMGMDIHTLSALENGRKPSRKTYAKLAEYMGVAVECLTVLKTR